MGLFCLNHSLELVRKEKKEKNKIESKEILKEQEDFREAYIARPQKF